MMSVLSIYNTLIYNGHLSFYNLIGGSNSYDFLI